VPLVEDVESAGRNKEKYLVKLVEALMKESSPRVGNAGFVEKLIKTNECLQLVKEGRKPLRPRVVSAARRIFKSG
jgi:hypothetical protein